MKAVFEVDQLQRQMEIGCADDEHGVQQGVSISLRATLDGGAMFAGDTRTPPFDYGVLVDAVDAALASRPRFILQETLVLAIAARVLAQPLIERLEIELDKTERYPGCRAIGVRAAFERADLAALAPHYPEDPVLAAFGR